MDAGHPGTPRRRAVGPSLTLPLTYILINHNVIDEYDWFYIPLIQAASDCGVAVKFWTEQWEPEYIEQECKARGMFKLPWPSFGLPLLNSEGPINWYRFFQTFTFDTAVCHR